jgi:hypothetical protein
MFRPAVLNPQMEIGLPFSIPKHTLAFPVMITKRPPTLLRSFISTRTFRVALALAPWLPAAAVGQEPEGRDYSRFVGLNLLIQQGNAYDPLIGIANGSAIIRANKEIRQVPFRDVKGYRIDRGLVIRTRRATLANLTAERVYTPANDPRTKWSSSQTAMLNQRSEDAGIAEMQYLMDPNPKLAEGTLNAALNSEGYSDLQQDGTAQDKIQQELDKQLFDAVQVEFEVSSPKPIPRPYVIIITEFRESVNSTETDNAIYMKELDPINSAPYKVTIVQGGLTPGYQLVGYEVHLFDNGYEVATNVVKDRVDLTRTEVFAYLTREYLSSHKGATLPPVSMGAAANARVRKGIDAEELNRRFEIAVGSDGTVSGCLPSDSSSGAVPGNVMSYLQGLHFYPALANGVPVDGKVEASLADLLR